MRQQTRRHSVLGAGARDVCVITLLKSAWHIHPFLLFVPSSHGGRSSRSMRCSSTSVLGKPSESTNTSGMYKMDALLYRSGCFLSPRMNVNDIYEALNN